jgi:hypothetical protein
MRTTIAPTAAVNAAVASTSVADRLLVTVWRDGEIVASNLEVSAYAFSWNAFRYVQGQATLIIPDDTGELLPLRLADPLAPGGSRLQIVYEFAVTRIRIPLGLWRIKKAKPRTRWQSRRLGTENIWLPQSMITIEADEELYSLYLAKIDIPDRQPTKATVLDEVEYLISRPYSLIDEVKITESIVDTSLRADVQYSPERLSNIQTLLDRVGATYRQGGSVSQSGHGTLEVVPVTGTPVDWLIAPGDDGVLIDLGYTMSDENLVNSVTSHVTLQDDETGEETLLFATSRLTEGPLRFDGPAGRIPVFRGANLATNLSELEADSNTTLERLSAQGDVLFNLVTLCHPGIQLFDRLAMFAPRFPFAEKLTGQVMAVSWQGRDGVTGKTMNLTFAVNHQQLEKEKTHDFQSRGQRR